MSAGARMFCCGLIVSASCLTGGCLCHSGGTPATAIGNRELPVGYSGPRMGNSDVAPTGFSSTYQRYQLDRRRLARQQAEQEAALKAVVADPSLRPARSRKDAR